MMWTLNAREIELALLSFSAFAQLTRCCLVLTRSQGSRCEICDGRGSQTRLFLQKLRVSLLNYHSVMLHSHLPSSVTWDRPAKSVPHHTLGPCPRIEPWPGVGVITNKEVILKLSSWLEWSTLVVVFWFMTPSIRVPTYRRKLLPPSSG
jgi:hypothetical protein